MTGTKIDKKPIDGKSLDLVELILRPLEAAKRGITVEQLAEPLRPFAQRYMDSTSR